MGLSETSLLDWYFQQLRGFFVPPVTANYSFMVRADDYARVYLSTNSSPAGEQLIAQQITWCGDFLCAPVQVSAPIPLVGGTPYWFRGACCVRPVGGHCTR